MSDGGKIRVEQIRGTARRPRRQVAVLNGLGLGRLGQSRILQDTAAVRGMVAKVSHLLLVKPADKS